MTMDLFAPKRVAPTLHHGDCLAVLRTLPDASVDSVVTDPPAGIAFMGKAWDEDKGGRRQWIAWMAEVMAEALRVLKPGGHAFVWALPRTSHWTATALEDAGFEVRDCLVHVFGSGFPKSMDVSKALAKRAGGFEIARAAVAWMKRERERQGISRIELEARIFGRSDGNVRNWEEGVSIPKEGLWPKIRDALGHSVTEFDAALERGDEIVAVEEGSFGFQKTGERWSEDRVVRSPTTDLAKQWEGWGTALKPASEHWWLVRKPLVGTVAANVERYGTGALNIDASRVVAAKGDEPLRWAHGRGLGFHGAVDNGPCEALTSEGRWPPNLLLSHTEDCTEGACADDCAVAEMDTQANGASRFFPVFRYQAKAAKSEKGATNVHPTVKSIGLMDWLIRLVTPPGGTVLDPFLGSGTTGVAAVKGGFGFIGIEREAEYLAIAGARIEAV